MSAVKPVRRKGSIRNYKKALLVWNVPEELRRRFKGRCAEEGRTMHAVLTEFMAAYTAQK